MSMLAEPRRKQRFTLNPRGKLWTQDANSFGQKMLKRMGWKNGKGLGANEDGKTEPLRVSYKNDSKGMGYKETEQWTAHDDNFASLLESLNGDKKGSDDNNTKVKSLETKGQNSKARIHYHKFTKAKDLSRYSEKDLANIFGRKTLKQKNTRDESNETDEQITEPNNTLEKEDILVNKGSMVDYFKKRLSNFKQTSDYIIGNNGVLKRERSDSESDVRPGFGFSQGNNDCNGDACEDLSVKKKKRKYAETFFTYSDKNTKNSQESNDVQNQKSKKHKLHNDAEVESSQEANGSDLTNYEENFVSVKKNEKKEMYSNFISYVSEDDLHASVDKINKKQDIDYENVSKQRKKKEKNKLNNSNLDNLSAYENNIENNAEIDEEATDDNFSNYKKKKKCKLNASNLEDNKESLSEDALYNAVINQESTDDYLSNSKKKKKFKLNANNLEDNKESLHKDTLYNDLNDKKLQDSIVEATASRDIMENSSKKKKKKSKDQQKDLDDNSKQITSEKICESASEPYIKKLKKHKKKKNEENNEINVHNENNMDNFEESLHKNEEINLSKFVQENLSENITEDNTDSVAKKKKKKKSRNSDLEESEITKEDEKLENPHDIKVFQINEKIIENTNENEDVSKKIKKKKSKKNKVEDSDNIGISNPAFNDFDNSIANEEQFLHSYKVENGNVNEDKRKTKKRKYSHDEEICNGGIDNPTFSENVDNLNLTSNEEVSNVYEVKVKKRKKKRSDEESNKSENIGLDNPALNLNDSIPDTDLILNIATTPTILKKSDTKFNSKPERKIPVRRKSVRFSDVLQERIIPNDPTERSSEYLIQRKEFFDINTTVIEDGIREELKKQGVTYESSPSLDLNLDNPKQISKKVVESSVREELNRGMNLCGFINNGFDIRSVDKVNFYETKYEVKSPNSKGIDNKAFNKVKNQIDENVESISNKIENCQAEVENNINEAKVNNNADKVLRMVGDVGTQIEKSIKTKEGSKLCFKEMHIKTPVPAYLKTAVSTSKKSYRHLIRGDITVVFKNSNLHDIPGYALKEKDKQE